MTKASPILENFNSGELSPLIDGRVGYEKYPNGASIMENFIPTVPGPIKRRGGTRFVKEVKDSTKKVLLIPFEFSVSQAYMLEFGNLYVRFYTWDATTKVRGILESSPGVPVEVVTPYTDADLYNSDGTPKLRFTQSGDFLYLAHPSYQQRILKRLTATSFSLTNYDSTGGPWKALNETATTVYASAETGTGITLTASTGIFQANHVGSIFYLESRTVDSIKAWEVGKVVSIADRRRSDAKTYEALTAGTTGGSKPIHTEGALYDGDPGVQWQFRDPGYGYVKITAFTSSTVVTADVVDRLPSEVVGSAKSTTRWAFGAWSTVEGWPSDTAFYRERLWWARKSSLWGSVSADYTDYRPKKFGQVTDDMAITVELASGTINDIQWLAPDKDLVAGTAGGEFAIGELTNGEPLSPTNRRARVMSSFGSRAIPPIKNSEFLLFVQRSGLKLRETFYDFAADGYKSSDATVLSDHITASGVTQMTFAQEPDQIVWAIRADGALIGYTWNNAQSVRSWHRHPIGGAGIVESIATMPAAEGDRTELWLSIKRTINGATKRYIEYMERPYRTGDAQNTQFYVDSGLVYSGAAATTITGLGHLEGKTVSVLADGSPHPDVTVTSGAVTLGRSVTRAQIGLTMKSRWRSMRIEAGAQDGTSQGKTKRIHKVVFRLFETGGGKYGTLKTGASLDEFLFRTGSDPMDQPVPLFSGDKVVAWPNGYDAEGYLGFEVDQPVAATIIAVMPQVNTADAR